MKINIEEIERRKIHKETIKEITVLWPYKLLTIILLAISFSIVVYTYISYDKFNQQAQLIMYFSISMLFSALSILTYGFMVGNNEEYYNVIGYENVEGNVAMIKWIGLIMIGLSIMMFLLSPLFIVIRVG